MAAGTMPDSSDELTMTVYTGTSMSMFSLSRLVGIGSRVQDLADDCNMIRLMSAVVAGVNSHSELRRLVIITRLPIKSGGRHGTRVN